MDVLAGMKQLETIFAPIAEKAEAGELPLLDHATEFARLARLMRPSVDEPWADEWEDFQHLANQLLHAVKKNEIHDAVMIVESLSDAQSYCHRTFME